MLHFGFILRYFSLHESYECAFKESKKGFLRCYGCVFKQAKNAYP